MSDCESGANSQLKALQARLDRVDDDLMAHYAGISTIVKGLAANTVTAAAVAPVMSIYNMSASGQMLIERLKGLVPGADKFRSLQHLSSAAMIDGMSDRVAKSAADVASAAAEQANDLVNQQTAAIEARTAAEAQGLTGDALIPFQEEVDRTTGQLSRLHATVSQAQGALSAIERFLGTCTDIASCRTRSQIIEP